MYYEFIQEDSILPRGQNTRTHTNSIIAGNENKRKSYLLFFSRFLQVAGFCRLSKEVVCRKSPLSTGRNGRLKPGRLLNIVGHIGVETRQFSISLP